MLALKPARAPTGVSSFSSLTKETAAKETAANEQGVTFLYPDTAPFQEAVLPLHDSVLASNPALQATYDAIMEKNAEYAAPAEETVEEETTEE